jgi:hypothetical protein
MMMLIKLRDGNIVSQAEPTQLYSAVADVVAKFDDMVVAHASPATQLPRCRLYFVPPVPEIVCIDIPNLQFILTKVLLWAASQVVGLRDSASVAVVVSLDSESGRKQIKFEVFDNGMSFGGATVESLLAATSTIPKVTLFLTVFVVLVVMSHVCDTCCVIVESSSHQRVQFVADVQAAAGCCVWKHGL